MVGTRAHSGAGFKSTRRHAAWTLEMVKQEGNDALRIKDLGSVAVVNLSGASCLPKMFV